MEIHNLIMFVNNIFLCLMVQASAENHNLAGEPTYHHHNSSNNTFVVHHNTHIPYMPSELRHTNYGNKTQLMHPQVGKYYY